MTDVTLIADELPELPTPAMHEVNPYLHQSIDPHNGQRCLTWYSAKQMQAFRREGVAALAAERDAVLAIADQWQVEAAKTWGESIEHATLQRCADEVRAALKGVANG